MPDTAQPKQGKLSETIVPAYRDGSGDISLSLNRCSEGDLYIALKVGDQLITLDADNIRVLVSSLQSMERARNAHRISPLKVIGREPEGRP